MFQLAKSIQSSGSEYHDSAFTGYRYRRFGNYISTASTFSTFSYDFVGIRHDRNNNYYSYMKDNT